MPDTRQIPTRAFGKTGVRISALGFGGHHLGDADDEKTAHQLVARAVDGGITFFDNCWEYHRGKSEIWMGGGLKGKRQQVFLMTKVCTHGREKSLALRMLEESLRRLQTDYLDLWQIHGVSFENDPALFIRPNGAAEALEQAKKDGKVRFVGFTGHKDPKIHLAMLETGFPFDSVQMPLNPFDGTFRSFEKQVVPELNRRDIAILGMKPLSGSGPAVKAGVISAEDSLRYAMSLPITTTITGMEKMDVLEQNLKIAQGFRPLNEAEMSSIRQRVAKHAADGRYEPYKVSLKFDNPEARLAHSFPLDMQSKEVKEMVRATQNTGDAFPSAK
ncbi:MAG TPA: aldo/keto reductase [Bryobacteraceae bacterium]|jgi:aryl-alcohol dehydrogenase-like predicted oxidoreductase|nr:aldo/keto reductase [Bryobacteraceae bacterium]